MTVLVWSALALGITSLVFAALWWRQTRTANATAVDAAWAVAIGAIGVTSVGLGAGSTTQRGLALALAVVWSGRLSFHLLRHRVVGHSAEDGRYRSLRAHWGTRAHRNFFWFYQLQAGAACVFALPFRFVAQHPSTGIEPLQWAGLSLFVLAQLAEGVADRQLQAHRRDDNQRGRTCRRGLWRYSRHPNYFFEWLSWCGIGLVAAPAAGALALLQPCIMLVLVRFVSGVPFTELQALRSRGDDYRRYQAETNAFVPWWPRLPHGGNP